MGRYGDDETGEGYSSLENVDDESDRVWMLLQLAPRDQSTWIGGTASVTMATAAAERSGPPVLVGSAGLRVLIATSDGCVAVTVDHGLVRTDAPVWVGRAVGKRTSPPPVQRRR